jgi:hypothetical protein
VARHRLRSLSFLAVLAVAAVVRAPAVEPELSIADLTAGQQHIVGWAVELFDEADLDLPRVTFLRFDSEEKCFGRAGAHLVENGRSVIRMCIEDTDRYAERIMLHELAHAWDRHALTEQRRAAFLRLRHLRVWRSKDAAWEEKGAEQAAEVIVWGLIDWAFSARIPDNSCAELLRGYVTLTGRQPLHGYTGKC